MSAPPPLRVALVGKGGAGKSVLSGTLARVLARRGHRVLAVDTDPMPGMAFSLGLRIGDDALLDGYAERDEESGWELTMEPQQLVEEAAVTAPDGVRFLQFGKADSASLAPLRSSLQALWAVTHSLDGQDWTVVHDLSAGTRQAFAGWAGATHGFLFVVEPTMKSVLTARRLAGLAATEGAPRVAMVVNKATGPADRRHVQRALPDLELAGEVPLDAAVAAADRAGLAPIDHAPDAPAVQAIGALADWLASSWATDTITTGGRP